jgi:hypothetical protein
MTEPQKVSVEVIDLDLLEKEAAKSHNSITK